MIDFDTFVKEINLDNSAIRAVESLRRGFSVDCLENQFKANKELFFEAVKQQATRFHIDFRVLFLYIYIELAIKKHDGYLQKGIQEKIYFDTMSDIAVWSYNCMRDWGVWGINEYAWLTRHMEMELFRLGRLQFETIVMGGHVSTGDFEIKKGAAVLNVHIPQGGPLIYGDCIKSYNATVSFFGPGYDTFVCHSWLLYPALRELLPADSNIIQFQTDYFIYEINDADRQCEERVFGEIKDDPDAYPQNTSLQRNIVAYLKSGKKLGTACGAFKARLQP